MLLNVAGIQQVQKLLDTYIYVNSENNDECESSYNKDDGEKDGKDAVDDCSCQHPVVFQLVLLGVFIALLCFILKTSLQ